MKRFVNLFPTPVMLVDMSDLQCKSKLLEIIDNSPTEQHDLVAGGRSSFSTTPILFDTQLAELNDKIHFHLDEYSRHLGLKRLQITNNWFNIMGEGNKVVRHRHEGSLISGAYYPRAPQGSTKLHFVNPLTPFRMTEIYNYDTPYSAYSQNVECIEDLMVLFPSWLEHYTEENTTSNRTVISFNTMISND